MRVDSTTQGDRVAAVGTQRLRFGSATTKGGGGLCSQGGTLPQFRYSAVGADGTSVKGSVDAVSAVGLENELLIQGHSAIKVKERKSLGQLEITPERVPPQEIMHMSRQLAAFVRTGIPLSEALRIVGEGVTNKRLRAIVVAIQDDIQSGTPLSDAIARNSEVFPPYYVSIVRSAELTGRLDLALDQLSGYIERDVEARAKVKSALTYPGVIGGMSVVTVLVMVLFVLPRFEGFFENLDSELPLATRMLLGFSEFVGNWWWAIIGVALVATVAHILSGRTEGGKLFRSRVLLKIPLIGDIVAYATVERFCRVVAAMMKAGVPLPQTMAAAIEGANNKVFERALVQTRDAMIRGDGIAGPIAETELFPNAMVQMFRVGEATGTLDQQAEGASQYFATELEYKLKKLTTIFEPAAILGMGVVVGFVAVALVSAMYGVFQGTEGL
jgi:type IV pilus assembly protein PilC